MWASLAASLVVALLKFLVQRQDTRRAILAEVERQEAHAALEALGWKVAHPVDVVYDPLSPDRLRDASGTVTLPADHPRPPSG